MESPHSHYTPPQYPPPSSYLSTAPNQYQSRYSLLSTITGHENGDDSPPSTPLPSASETIRFLDSPGPRSSLSLTDTDKKHFSSYSSYSQFSQFSQASVLDNPDRKTLWAKRARLIVQVTIVASFIAAAIVAVLHHVFLSRLDGQFVTNYSTIDREWIGRMSNIFGQAVVTLLRIVVVTTLVQVAWTAITLEYTTIADIDDLFQLPSSVAALGLFRRNPKFRMLSLVALSALSLALALVGTLAPAALVIDTPWVTGNLTVPILDLITAVVNPDLSVLDDQIRHSLLNNVAIEWTLPPQCQSACWFELEYAAPGLDCRFMNDNETDPALVPFDLQTYAGGQDWTFYQSIQGPSVKWATNNAPLNFSLIPFEATYSASSFQPTSVNMTGPIQGQFCEFVDKTYRANFTYIDNVKNVTMRVISDTNTYGQSCTWTNPDTLSADCVHYADAAGNIANGYSVLFNGTGVWNQTGVLASWNQYFTRNLLVYTNDTRHDTLTLDTADSFSEAVEKGFENAVLTVILIANQSIISSNSSQLVDGDFGGGVPHILETSIWGAKFLFLWEVYIPALLLGAIAGVYGLYCARRSVSGILRDQGFSSFFIATRTKDLDVICAQHADIFMSSSLKHDPHTGRFSVLKTGRMKKRMSVKGFQTIHDEAKIKRWPRTEMIFGFALAIVTALGHHFFLSFLNGKHAEVTLQSWVKVASNAFAYAVAGFLAISAGYALTQATWRALQLQSETIGDLDDIFRLPSVISMLSLLRKSRKVQIFYLLIIAGVIEALALITVFAPNALTVDSVWRTNLIDSPSANLGGAFLGGSDEFQNVWTDHTAQSLSQPPEVKWSTLPAGCGESCSFTIQYEAPALVCRDLQPEEYTVTTYDPSSANSNWTVYDWTFADDSAGDEGKTYDPTPFIINYVSMTSQADGLNAPMINANPPTGSYCACTDGSYELGFNFTNNALMLNTTLLAYKNSFTTLCTGTNSDSMSDGQRDACLNYRDNADIICGAFASAFQGQISLNTINGTLVENIRRPAVMERLINMSLFTTDTNTGQAFLLPAAYPGANNLTTFLPRMFGNLTTSLLPDLNSTVPVWARVKDSGQRWIYNPLTLVCVYIPALALVLGVMVYAIYCIRANGNRVIESDFTTFLTTTRNDNMDKVYDSAKNFEDLLSKRIVFSKDGFFVADHQHGDGDEVADEDGDAYISRGRGYNRTQSQKQEQAQHLLFSTYLESPTTLQATPEFPYRYQPQSPKSHSIPQSRPNSILKGA